MKRRIFLVAALLSALAVLATSILITISAYNVFFETVQREVVSQVSYVQAGIETAGEDYLGRIELQSGHRITLIAANGVVLFDSVSNPEQMDNHLDRPEVRAALASGAGEATRQSDTINEQTYYYALRMNDGTVLRLSSTTANIFAYYDRLFNVVILIALAVLACTAVVASFATQGIVRPINRINLNHPENMPVYEELTPLLARIKQQRELIDTQMSELDRGRKEFISITENMKEGLLVLNCDGRVLSNNQSAVHLLGLMHSNLSGSNILSLNRSEPFREGVQQALSGTASEQLVTLRERCCQLYANPVVADGSVQGAVLLLMDITEKQERDKLRREFTANVSHELKTPLTSISGYAEIMANGMVKAEAVPEFSGCIYSEAQRMIALVKDLMFLSNLDEGVAPPKEQVDLLAISRDVAGRLKAKATESGITVTVSGEPEFITGVPSVLEEMVYNLTDNAIKYNQTGGMVAIVVEQNGENVRLSVSDTGRGIPPSKLERIFERFYRVDKSRNEAVEGTGLGLAIVKHGAAMHDAKVEVKSDSNGSRFMLVFSQADKTTAI